MYDFNILIFTILLGKRKGKSELLTSVDFVL